MFNIKVFKIVAIIITLMFILTSCKEEESIVQFRENTESSSLISDIIELEEKAVTEEKELDNSEKNIEISETSETEDIDIDLTKMNNIMLSTQVYNMMYTPDDYIGQSVKITGEFDVFYDENTKNNYFLVTLLDETGCCVQGLEFTGDYVYPDDYPQIGSNITVTGTFSYYTEGPFTYCTLADSVLTY